ncbi:MULTISPECIES: porphobilinogen synthase [unclassified Fusibacter]|uniref:porphobilinogen synthase n=1 Tax=unclassified Fusibacter TaxID=2624464 RepID=UPI0010122A11|nr:MULTISPECIES: porphobilinogen synthase [unclassified Fusibacter]MCK8060522.1 porphobilinogen synthase [Fusibacter sp. A2]NPE20189.1 porphobilinogen synthase [Fusibacter sp. A1]RXV63399.1 porphobilinogen synthase [Fusibacter sp. A1]
MIIRPRRNRKNENIRKLVRETRLNIHDLVAPIFAVEGVGVKEEIGSLPEVFHYSVDELKKEAVELFDLGIRAVLLFGVPSSKDSVATSAYDDEGIVQRAIRGIKEACPEMIVITDVCMCQYTDHGHCGILNEDGSVLNDETLEYLSRIAVSHAVAGADIVAPSDMMDGRVGAIRASLDRSGYQEVNILSYAIKYASNLYGPFREAAHSAPSFGDRKAYQMDYHNKRDALREIELDTLEGADMLMVKPASMYLDILSSMKEVSDLPLVCYHVSGEYAMLYHGVTTGIVDERAIYEQMIAFKRAGADLIITYFSKYLAKNMEAYHHEF